jgi:phage gp45-like
MLDVRQWLEALRTRILMLLVRGLVNRTRYAGEVESEEKGFTQLLQIRGLAGEVLSDVEYLEPYGFASRVQQDDPGAEHLAVSIAGDRSRTIVLVVRNRNFGLKLKPGEVAIFDDIGQSVRLHQDGTIAVKANSEVRVHSKLQMMAGKNIQTAGTVQAGVIHGSIVKDDSLTTPSLEGMRAVFNLHTHPGSGPPEQQM